MAKFSQFDCERIAYGFSEAGEDDADVRDGSELLRVATTALDRGRDRLEFVWVESGNDELFEQTTIVLPNCTCHSTDSENTAG